MTTPEPEGDEYDAYLERRRAILDARQSSALEGTRSTELTQADQDAYVRGEIDINELGERVRARHGLNANEPRPEP